MFINRSFELIEFKSTIRIEKVCIQFEIHLGMNEWCNNLLVNLQYDTPKRGIYNECQQEH